MPEQSKVAEWKPLSITLEGEKLEIIGPVQGDDAVNSFVWIPSLKAVVAGA